MRNYRKLTAVLSAAMLLTLSIVPTSRAQPRGVLVVSPELTADRHITFRILAPKAEAVQLASSGDIPGIGFGQARAMTKGTNGVWEVTVGPLPPGAYRYGFNLDGVVVCDPRNPKTSESNENSWSLVQVPGADWMDTRAVPHGAVSEVTYWSDTLKRFRRLHVYTPPGYESGKGKFPILYLLHGAFDSDASWSAVGRAGFILDNLIAVSDIMPQMEKRYRVYTDRRHRAMAGLSMGGAHTLNIGIPHLDKFAYLGVFSSGIFGITGGPGSGQSQGPSFEEKNKPILDEPKLKKDLKLFWFATGKDDFLVGTTRATVAMLKQHKFDITYQETDGAHTWDKWRVYLHDFAPQLFQK